MDILSKELQRIDQLQEEVQSQRPLSPYELGQLREYYRIGLTYSSNAIEGNSLTESETKVIIEDGLTIGGKSLREHMEVLGHSEAFSFVHSLAGGNLFTQDDLLHIHRLVYGRIDAEQAGRYRTQRIFLTGSRHAFPRPEDLPSLMADFFTGLPAMKATMHPVVFAARVHRECVFIHPFVDGNGRVARLVMNLLLLQAGYLVTIIPPVLRSEYIASLEAAHDDDVDFIRLVLRCHIEAQKEYLRLLG